MEIQYTTKQKREITKSINFISHDIMKLIHQAKLPSFSYKIKFKNGHSYNSDDYRTKCLFQDKALWQIVYDSDNYLSLKVTSGDLYFSDDISLGKKFFKQEMTKSMWAICLEFIMTYSDVREDLISKIEKRASEVNAYNTLIDENIKEAKNKLHNLENAIIEFNFPPSIAKKEIEIEKKDGKTIGTINFGERSISIITSGDIVLVPKKEEKPKVKEK